MEIAVYILCAATAALASALLVRGWRRSRSRLLLLAGLCFAWFTVGNVVLIVDRVVLPEVDLALWTHLPSFLGMMTLLGGLIWEMPEP